VRLSRERAVRRLQDEQKWIEFFFIEGHTFEEVRTGPWEPCSTNQRTELYTSTVRKKADDSVDELARQVGDARVHGRERQTRNRSLLSSYPQIGPKRVLPPIMHRNPPYLAV
jgi:cobalamin biosynthesis protein CobT